MHVDRRRIVLCLREMQEGSSISQGNDSFTKLLQILLQNVLFLFCAASSSNESRYLLLLRNCSLFIQYRCTLSSSMKRFAQQDNSIVVQLTIRSWSTFSDSNWRFVASSSAKENRSNISSFKYPFLVSRKVVYLPTPSLPVPTPALWSDSSHLSTVCASLLACLYTNPWLCSSSRYCFNSLFHPTLNLTIRSPVEAVTLPLSKDDQLQFFHFVVHVVCWSRTPCVWPFASMVYWKSGSWGRTIELVLFFMRVNFRLLLSMRNFPTCALQNAISKDLTTTEGSEIITREIRGPNYHALQCTLYIDAPTPLCPSASWHHSRSKGSDCSF